MKFILFLLLFASVSYSQSDNDALTSKSCAFMDSVINLHKPNYCKEYFDSTNFYKNQLNISLSINKQLALIVIKKDSTFIPKNFKLEPPKIEPPKSKGLPFVYGSIFGVLLASTFFIIIK